MSEQHDILEASERYERRSSLMLIAGVLLVWSALLAIDWYGRFAIFRWHDGMIRKPSGAVSTVGPERPMIDRTDPGFFGGDLTQLIGIEEVARAYGQEKPPTRVVTDEYGYRNTPPTDGVDYPVVISGDSFLHRRYGEDGSYAEYLEKALNERVYNHAYPGKGAFWGMHRFLSDPRFHDRRPDVIVWGCLERELSGIAFAGFVYQVWRLENPEQEEVSSLKPATGIAWERLGSKALRKSLPDSSILAAMTTRAWNKLRYYAFGAITDDVVESLPGDQGERQLFYGISLDALSWPSEIRDAEKIGWGAEYIRNYCLSNSMELVVLLIPDKESVYREQIPVSGYGDPQSWPPSTLHDIEAVLNEKGIPVVNLLPAFRDAAKAGTSLYWRDDTHWMPEAMEIAASLTAPVVRDIVDRE